MRTKIKRRNLKSKGGISDSTMQRYWRLAVAKQCNYKCAVTGRTTNLQCHHWLRDRGHLLTRNDRRNGILVSCDSHAFEVEGRKQYLTPHQWLENTPMGKRWANDYMVKLLGQESVDELTALAQWNLAKQYFISVGTTRLMYLRSQLDSLKSYVKE